MEEKVEIANGKLIPDFTLVKKPNIVIIVATTGDNKIIILQEYKHGAEEVLLCLPAGHVKDTEEPVKSAKRELEEETGYTSDNFQFIQILREYPSKDRHKVFVVKANNIYKIGDQNLDENESITFELVDIEEVKNQIKNNLWKSSSNLAAMLVCGIL